MRIEEITVKNWRCISSVTLGELNHDIVIVYGPNRIGKSSIVEALRAALLDFHATTEHRTIRGAQPWTNGAAPEVAVVFSHDGCTFRIRKRFLSNEEEVLEQLSDGRYSVVTTGKNATRKVREMLGVDATDKGWCRLLWMPQGEVGLPSKVDSDLRAAVESVLGALVAEGDIAFREELGRRLERWFTPSGRERQDSPVRILQGKLDNALEQRREIEEKLRSVEAERQRYEELVQRYPELKRQLEEAIKTRDELKAKSEEVREKAYRHEIACEKLKRAQEQVSDLERKLNDLDRLTADLEQENEQLTQLETDIATLEKSIEEFRAGLNVAEQEAQQARSDEVRLREESTGTIAAREQLLALARDRERLRNALEDARKLTRELTEVREELSKNPAPSEAELAEIENQRDTAKELRAQVEAGEIEVQFQAETALRVSAEIDQEPEQAETLSSGREATWRILRQATIRLADVGTLSVKRQNSDHDLEEAARQLEAFESRFRQVLRRYSVPIDTENPLAVLRQHMSEALKKRARAESLEEQLRRLAPKGIDHLEMGLAEKERRRETILVEHGELKDWLPDEADIKRIKDEYRNAIDGAAKRVAETTEKVRKFSSELESVKNSLGKAREKRSGIEAKIAQLEARIEELGKREDLAAALAEAKTDVERIQEEVKETELSDEEKEVAGKFDRAERSVQQRRDRLADNERQQDVLRATLQQTEGLHQKLIEAEERVADLERHLVRETLRRDAHKRLAVLFDDIRKTRVRRTLAPINEQVMEWIRRLRVEGYSALAFEDQPIPTGLELRGSIQGKEPVPLDNESMGTVEQLAMLVRLAIGRLLAKQGDRLAVLDDPLPHSDPVKHRRMLDVFEQAVKPVPDARGRLQLLIFTCHPDRFDGLDGARYIDLERELSSAV